jgi:glycosyltransferase 2 family protein
MTPPDLGSPPVAGRVSARRLVLRLLFSGGVLGLLFVILPWAQVTEAVSRMTAVLYLGALAAFAAGHALGATKWRIMMAASIGGPRLSLRDTAGCYGAGLFANLFLPTVVGGDVVRAGLATRALGRPEAVALGSIADRLIDFAALGLLIAGGVAFAGAELTGWAAPLTAVVAVVAIGTAALLLPLALRRPLTRWPRRLRRRAGRGLVALRRLTRAPRLALTALALSLSMQTAFILISAWLGGAVGAGAPLWAWFVAWPLAKAAGMLPVSVGGLGVRDAALAGLLVPFGVPMAVGLVASLAWQSVMIGGALLGGLLGLLFRPGRRSRRPLRAASSYSGVGATTPS